MSGSGEFLAEIRFIVINAYPQNCTMTAKRDREDLPLRIHMGFGGALGVSQILMEKTYQPKCEIISKEFFP